MLILGTDARTQQTAKKSLTIYSHRAIKASVLTSLRPSEQNERASFYLKASGKILTERYF